MIALNSKNRINTGIKNMGKYFLILWIVISGCSHQKKNSFPSDGVIYTPVKVKGEVGENKGGNLSSSELPRLSSIQVKPVDPEDAEENASEVEKIIAFKNYSNLNNCKPVEFKSDIKEGCVAVEFRIEVAGKVSSTPSVVLTTLSSSSEGEFYRCLEETIKNMDFSELKIEKPSTFHVIFKYSL